MSAALADPVAPSLLSAGPSPVGEALRAQLGLITPEELAVTLGVLPETLKAWRWKKTGPDFVRLGQSVFYRIRDVEEWIAASIVLTTRQVPEQ